MTLLIAFLLIKGFNLDSDYYFFTTIVWFFHVRYHSDSK